MNKEEIIQMIPPEVLELRNSNQLHKLAQVRTGIQDYGLDTAVGYIAKRAFYNRHVNKAIAASINALDTLSK